MKKTTMGILVCLAAMSAAVLGGCGFLGGNQVAVEIGAGTEASGSKALAGGEIADPITAYRVVFKKIEIGNSEADKFTLWESEAGELKDVVSAVSFDNANPVQPGVYNYVRLTIGTTLSVDGSVTDGSDGTVYTGTGACVLANDTYLWGTNIENFTGELTLGSPVTIAEGSSLYFHFQIGGTVHYESGPADAAVLSVTKPVLNLITE